MSEEPQIERRRQPQPLGVSLGSWLQWGLPILAGVAAWYIGAVVAPLDKDLQASIAKVEKLETLVVEINSSRSECMHRIAKLESATDLLRQHTMATYQSKEQAQRDYDHLLRLLDNAHDKP